MTWLLCDYGEVLCLPQPDADRAAIETAAGGSSPGQHRAQPAKSSKRTMSMALGGGAACPPHADGGTAW